ncbi:MAG: DUF4340 domain-containing protein, partial [Polyangiaceae bacterium]|nr:DUF4340 domain-containing protein [Polyangiaceae bacterium]
MSRKTTIALLVAALGLFTFIWFVERDMLSSGEVAQREQRLLPRLVRARVTDISIERGEEKITLHRAEAASAEEEAKWALVDPVRSPADSNSVATLLGALEWAEPSQRLNDISADDRRLFGLDSPRLRASFKVGSETQTLIFGGEDPTGAGYYAALEDSGRAFVVGRDVFEAFDHDASHFRSKQLFGDELPNPARLTVSGPAGSFSVSKEARGYSLTAPVAMRALDTRVDAVVDALREVKATRFLPVGTEASDLETPFLKAELEVDGSERVLRVGAPCAGHQGERIARLDDGPVVCVAEATLAPLLIEPL